MESTKTELRKKVLLSNMHLKEAKAKLISVEKKPQFIIPQVVKISAVPVICNPKTPDLVVGSPEMVSSHIHEDEGASFTTLCSLLRRGEEETKIKTLIGSIKDSINKCDPYGSFGETLLHLSASNGYHQTTLALLETGAEVNSVDAHGNTPLHSAADLGHVDCCRLLCKYGANIEARELVHGDTPLHRAVAPYDFYECAKVLLGRGADSNAANNRGLSPLHKAAACSSYDCISLLLEKEADINLQDKENNTPLHKAVSSMTCTQETVQILLEGKADVTKINIDSENPLAIATRRGIDKAILNMLQVH